MVSYFDGFASLYRFFNKKVKKKKKVGSQVSRVDSCAWPIKRVGSCIGQPVFVPIQNFGFELDIFCWVQVGSNSYIYIYIAALHCPREISWLLKSLLIIGILRCDWLLMLYWCYYQTWVKGMSLGLLTYIWIKSCLMLDI